MFFTDISGNNLIAVNNDGKEIVVEIAPKWFGPKELNFFLKIENYLVKWMDILLKNKLK